MNKLIQSLLATALAVGLSSAAFGQSFIGNADPNIGDSGVFAFWNFNNGSSATTGLTFAPSALAPAFGSGSLSLSGLGDPDAIGYFAGTVTNLPSPDPDETGRGAAIAIQNGNDGINNGTGIIFTLDMTNLQGLAFSFAGQRTSTGFNSLVVDYSTDGGSNWLGNISVTTLESSMGTTSSVSASIRNVDLSSVSGLSNISNAQIRLTFDGGTITASAGNNRLDNFQFTATAVPEPATYAAIFGALALGLAMVRRRVRR
jgi:hypothetical protein